MRNIVEIYMDLVTVSNSWNKYLKIYLKPCSVNFVNIGNYYTAYIRIFLAKITTKSQCSRINFKSKVEKVETLLKIFSNVNSWFMILCLILIKIQHLIFSENEGSYESTLLAFKK